MSKIKKIVNNSLEDDIKPKVVYNSAKLSQYFNIKDPVPQSSLKLFSIQVYITSNCL